MNHLLPDLLTTPVFSLWQQPVSGLELLAVLTGLGSVWFTYKLHIVNWPLGMVSVASYGSLFLGAKLYADALLQVAFFVLCAYGWVSWARGTRPSNEGAHILVARASRRQAALTLAIALTALVGIALALHRYTDSPAPAIDAAIFSLSLAATYGQAKAWLESWWLWITVDIISVPLYYSRGLPLTAVLYVIFLLICLRGLAAWRAQLVSPTKEATA
jgi:nicotinamide mononucleotide transporter